MARRDLYQQGREAARESGLFSPPADATMEGHSLYTAGFCDGLLYRIIAVEATDRADSIATTPTDAGSAYRRGLAVGRREGALLVVAFAIIGHVLLRAAGL